MTKLQDTDTIYICLHDNWVLDTHMPPPSTRTTPHDAASLLAFVVVLYHVRDKTSTRVETTP